MTAEKPRTGWVGRGNWMPLMTAVVAGGVTRPAPDAGPGARVSAGRTARPARVGGRWLADAAVGSSAPIAARPPRTAGRRVTRRFMMCPFRWRSGHRRWGGAPGTRGRGPDLGPGRGRDRNRPTEPGGRPVSDLEQRGRLGPRALDH